MSDGRGLVFAVQFLMAGPALCAEHEPQQMRLPEYSVLRSGSPIKIDGVLDEPAWIAAPQVGPFQFPWWNSGRKEQTVAKLLWDNEHLYVAHICEDGHITARHTERDGQIPADDCFEIMLAPDPERPNVYFNLEWNVLGGLVDNHRPNGPNQPRAPKWDAKDVRVAGKSHGTLNDHSDEDQCWTVEVAIPLRNFRIFAGHIPPEPGDVWNVNFNRHGGDVNVQYSQWSPGDTPRPSFHTPHRFGRVIFSDRSSPFGAFASDDATTTGRGPATGPPAAHLPE